MKQNGVVFWPGPALLGHKSMEKNSVRNLQYGPKTRLIRGIDEKKQAFLGSLN